MDGDTRRPDSPEYPLDESPLFDFTNGGINSSPSPPTAVLRQSAGFIDQQDRKCSQSRERTPLLLRHSEGSDQ